MDTILTREQLLNYWLGHRCLTRRVVKAFPNDEAFASFSVGEMRPFAVLVNEFRSMAVPTLTGIVSSEWQMGQSEPLMKRKQALEQWDRDTRQIKSLWSEIPDNRLQETETTFGQYTTRVGNLLLYVIDNEVHHRGQGYVYLRALGVEPPQFPDRS